jgi:hypothetical protein
MGRAITLRGIVYGKGFERKKECILFSLKTLSHKTVSNHSEVTLLRGLCGLEHSWLQECGREIKTQNLFLLHSEASSFPELRVVTLIIRAPLYPAAAAATPRSNALRFDSKNACFVDFAIVSFTKSPLRGKTLLPINAPNITIFNESGFPA